MRHAINFTGDSPLWGAARFGGGGQTSGTSTSQVTYSPEETAARNAIFSEGERLYGQSLPQASTYQGPAPVPASPATQFAQNLGLATGAAAAGTIPTALNTTNFLLRDAANVNSNPYLQGAISAAIQPQTDAFTRTIMPTLRMGGMQTGTLGSSRQGVAEGMAASDLIRNIGNTAATMSNAGYNTGLDAMSSTVRNLPAIMSGISSPSSIISGVGAQQENIAGEQEAYNALVREQSLNGPWQLLQARAGLLNSVANPVTTTTSSMPRQGVSPLQIGGLAASAIPMAMGKSRRSLKEAVVRLGEIDGVPVYQFRYIGESGVFVGTMLDEAPAHAREGEFVNYTKLPVPFRQVAA